MSDGRFLIEWYNMHMYFKKRSHPSPKTKKTHNQSKTIIIVLLASIVLAAVTIAYTQKNTPQPTDLPSQSLPTVPVQDSDYLNLNPPTEEDNQEVEQNKNDISTDEPTKPQDQDSVNMVITYSGYSNKSIQVSSYAANIFEEGGTCALTLTRGDAKVTKQTMGQTDARYTFCPTFDIPFSEISSGTWSGRVSYTSQKYNGVSETFSIEVTP